MTPKQDKRKMVGYEENDYFMLQTLSWFFGIGISEMARKLVAEEFKKNQKKIFEKLTIKI